MASPEAGWAGSPPHSAAGEGWGPAEPRSGQTPPPAPPTRTCTALYSLQTSGRPVFPRFSRHLQRALRPIRQRRKLRKAGAPGPVGLTARLPALRGPRTPTQVWSSQRDVSSADVMETPPASPGGRAEPHSGGGRAPGPRRPHPRPSALLCCKPLKEPGSHCLHCFSSPGVQPRQPPGSPTGGGDGQFSGHSAPGLSAASDPVS